MNGICSILTPNDGVFTEVKKLVNGSNDAVQAYRAAVVENDDFTESFKEFCSDKFGEIDKIENSMVAQAIIEFAHIIPDGRSFNSDRVSNSNVRSFGYSNAQGRKDALDAATDHIVESWGIIVGLNRSSKDDALSWAIKELSNFYNALLFKRLKNVTGRDKQSFKSEIASAKSINEVYDILSKHLGGENISLENANLIAACKEMSLAKKDMISDILSNPKLFMLRRIIVPDDTALANTVASEALDVNTQAEDDTSTFVDEVLDMSITKANTHDGVTSNFLDGIDNDVKVYLNSIPKLAAPFAEDKVIYDTDNLLGAMRLHDGNNIASILYSRASFYSVDEFIQSIIEISQVLPGYYGLGKMANDLANDYDLAYKIYRNFAKWILSRQQTIVVNGKKETRVSNRETNSIDALRFRLLNDVKTSSINFDTTISDKLVNAVLEAQEFFNSEIGKDSIKDIKNNKDFVDEQLSVFKAAIYDAIKYYYPTISQKAVYRFIEEHKEDSYVDKGLNDYEIKVANADTLVKLLYTTIKGAKDTLHSYDAKIKESRKAQIENDKASITNKKDVSEIWSESYISNDTERAALELGKLLGDFENVKIQLNVSNIYGNNVSAITNPSFLGFISDMLNSIKEKTRTENGVVKKYSESQILTNFGKYRFQGHQYDLSNILMEHRDDKGQIINRGLFRKTNEGFEITDYARDLLKIKVYDGSSNLDTNTNTSYANSSSNDFITTAFSQFEEVDAVDKKNKITVGNFFIRTPSDASKTFCITAPIYDTKNLFKLEEGISEFAVIQNYIQQLPFSDDYTGVVSEEKQAKISLDKLVSLLTSGTIDDIVLYKKDSVVEISNENDNVVGSYTFKYEDKNGNKVSVVVEGNIENVKGKSVLVNPKLTKVLGHSIPSNVNEKLSNYYKEIAIREGKLRYKLNMDNPIAKQWKQMFMQDLLTAHYALEKFFKLNDDGSVFKNEDGSVEWVNGFNSENTKYNTHDQYFRRGKDGVIKNENGIDYLTGRVFGCERFTVTDRNTGKAVNYMEEMFSILSNDAATIDFLYGGAINNFLHFKDGNVELTDAQNAKFEECLNRFANALVNDARNRLEPYTKYINPNGKHISTDKIVKFMTNYHVMYNNFDDLFEGDARFYKSTEDFLKRAKEIQGSGVRYSNIDMNQEFEDDANEPESINKAKLNNIKFVHKKQDGTLEEVIIGQKSRFSGVTVANTIRTDKDTSNRIRESLAKQLVKEEKAKYNTETLTKEQFDKIKAKVESMVSKFENFKANDAQSYITFEEWVRRIAGRGQLEEYRELIEAIYDETKPVDAATMNKFVQVQKNFYFDIHYYPQLGISAPRQIKNAEMVLIPRFIKGTELEAIYNVMKENGIDQLNTVETSKASKINILTLWNNDGVLTEENLNKFRNDSKIAKEYYDYRFLYTQQETPQHMDAFNKFGIQISKKIIDNISDPVLLARAAEYQKLYSANIKASRDRLCEELDIELTPDGKIKFENGKLKMNYKKFYEKFKTEFMRLGMDKNMMDFVTLIEGTDIPKMPNYLSSARYKFENVAQAIFNSAITRQKLKGFHGPQVTTIGYKMFGNEKPRTLYDKNLEYHPRLENGEIVHHIEIMVPVTAFGLDINQDRFKGKSEDEILDILYKEIVDAKLDTVIGYRIPSESKHSACVMHIKGFLPSSYGSTIVVPDMWVAQTGSDFDIDSIYGIQYEHYFDKDGIIHKVEYNHNKEDLYTKYIIRKLKEAKQNDVLEELFKFAKIDKDTRKAIRDEVKEEFGRIDVIEVQDRQDKEHKDLLFAKAKLIAKKQGFELWDNFNKKDITELNSDKARNNRMLECMIQILQHPSSLVENLSANDPHAITESLDNLLSEEERNIRHNRSPYNFLDQADFQNEMTSGINLKGFSVTMDTLASVCNRTKAELPVNIKVWVDENISDKELEQRYGKGHVTKIGGKRVVLFNKLGWSYDNNAVTGDVLTDYTGKTTGHILDVAKEGSIPNVDEYSFGVYKLFPNLGIDYDTCIAFMLQPGVTEIVNANNENNSIFNTDYWQNPIDLAIRRIASKLSKIKVGKYDRIQDILAKIEDEYGYDVYKGYDTPNYALNWEFDKRDFEARLNTSTPVEEDYIKDLIVVLQFKALKSISDNCTALARVLNPDRFGAKQSIYETREVFANIKDYLTSNVGKTLQCEVSDKSKICRTLKDIDNHKNDEIIYIDSKLASSDDFEFKYDKLYVITEDDKISILDAIYPGARFGIETFIGIQDQGSYSPLNSMLKYATASSILVNSQLFETQSDDFIYLTNQLSVAFSHGSRRVSIDRHRDFENYILSQIYKQSPYISGSVKKDAETGEWLMDTDTDTDAERRRILGIGVTPSITIQTPKVVNNQFVYDEKTGIQLYDSYEFSVINKFHPTQKELDDFAKLSPAQKVYWLKQNFRNLSLLDYINVNLYNTRDYVKGRTPKHTMTFLTNDINIDDIRDSFEDMFYSTNPLIAMTALDIIKYAFVSENYSMKKNGISRSISNGTLTGENSTELVSTSDRIIKDLINVIDGDTIVEDYIRSTSSELKEIKSKRVEKVKGIFELNVDTSKGSSIILDINSDKEKIEKYNIGTFSSKGELTLNKYVKLKFGVEQLFRIEDCGNKVLIYPLNALEKSESQEFSSNPSNTNPRFYSRDYYKRLADAIRTTANITEVKVEPKDEEKYKKPTLNIAIKSVPFDINTLAKTKHSLEYIIDGIEEYFSIADNYNDGTAVYYFRNNDLRDYIKADGDENGSTQIINGKTYRIYKVSAQEINTASKNGNQQIKDFINDAVSTGYALRQVFGAYPVSSITDSDTVRRNSTLSDFEVKAVKAMTKNETSGNEHAKNAKKLLNQSNIIFDAKNLEANTDIVVPILAEYTANMYDDLMKDLTQFVKDETTKSWIPMDDIRAIEIIKDNKALRNKYVKIIGQTRAFVEQNSIVNNLDLTSEDNEIRKALELIKDRLNKLENSSIIRNAERMFATEYLQKLSDNPLYREDIVDILDGYGAVGWFDAWINDLQETTNPVIQVLSKDIMSDIRGAELQAIKAIGEMHAELDRIKGEAASHGMTVNMDKLVKDGDFVKDFNPDFEKELNRLYTAMIDAKAKPDGIASREFVEARFAYEKFKIDHVEQPLVKKYYQEHYDNDYKMFHDNPELYLEYLRLLNERDKINSHKVRGKLEDTYQQQLSDINTKIWDLSSLMTDDWVNGGVRYKKWSYEFTPTDGNPRIHSREAADRLSKYIEENQRIRQEYYKKDTKFGFESELKKNLDIINKYEKYDSFGRLITPIEDLMQIPEYKDAKEWISANCKLVPNSTILEQLNNAYNAVSVKGGKNSSILLGSIAKLFKARTGKSLYDNEGVLNPFELEDGLLDKIIDNLKIEQETEYNQYQSGVFSDRGLINNATDDGVVYTDEFYKSMTSNGVKAKEYITLQQQFNDLVRPYYIQETKTVKFDEMSESELVTLLQLVDALENTKKHINASNGQAIKDFIDTYVTYDINQAKFDELEANVRLKHGENSVYHKRWLRVNTQTLEDGTVIPRILLYGKLKPKDKYNHDVNDTTNSNKGFINGEKTKAIQYIKQHVRTVETKYYEQARQEAAAKGKDYLHEWEVRNHVYNPNTHKMEPLRIWLKQIYLTDSGDRAEEYEANYNQEESNPKPEAINSKYKEDVGITNNYIVGTGYDNNTDLNKYEKEIKDYLQSVLLKIATTKQAKRFINEGHIPSRIRSDYSADDMSAKLRAKIVGEEVAKYLGWIETSSGVESWYNHIDGANDVIPSMPMTTLLRGKGSIPESERPVYPKREDNMTDEEYNAKLKKYHEDLDEYNKVNLEIHKQLVDKDYISSIEEFIKRAAHFNAVQENKWLMYYGQQLIKTAKVYDTNLGFNNLRHDALNSTEESKEYVKKTDDRLYQQYTNWIRRLIYDMYKEPNNKFTKFAGIMQSITSSNYMMMNITGGIANVTVGGTQILAEAAAGDYLNSSELLEGTKNYFTGVVDYAANAYSEKSSTLAGGIIKMFNVVDFDEYTGVVHTDLSAKTVAKRLRDAMFLPQTIGEHFMQNSVMLGMMHSHRLVKLTNFEERGKTEYQAMTEAEYVREATDNVLKEYLSPDLYKKYEEIKEQVKKDANKAKEYAWFRSNIQKDFCREFLNVDQIKEFKKKREDAAKQAKEDFKQFETLYNQFELNSKNGIIKFKDGSILAKLDAKTYRNNSTQSISDAYKIIGEFKGRVISVNKKIHGVYDRLGSAQIEKYWWGSLAMQYHKHILPGMMKRWRRKGYFNEERGSIEKGFYWSLLDLLAAPVNKIKLETNMTDAEEEGTKAIQNILKMITDYCTNVKLNWYLLPEYEKANCRRAIGEISGVLSALFTAVALRMMYDDDDDSIIYNLCLYESDRLASESMQFNPYGAFGEAKKLYSSPIAAQSIVSDVMSSAGLLARIILEGDDAELEYTSGRFAGENKLGVYVKRRIPIYRGIDRLFNIADNNQYYKLQSNFMGSTNLNSIVDFIEGK